MKLSIAVATPPDAAAIAALRNRVAERLTRDFGQGHWSGMVTEKGVLRGITTSRVLVARHGRSVVGTLLLATRKPWAIDPTYFLKVQRPLYLLDMAVEPDQQRRGIGRRLIEEAIVIAKAWPAESMRLDVYDAEAGAVEFYATCGFREAGRVSYRGVPLVYYEMLL